MQNFVAIDFETANFKPESVCSVGICIVKDGEIEDNYYSLIRPVPNYYCQRCQDVHGLGPSDTNVMDAIKFIAKSMLQTGCRFLIVDAINKDDTLSFYQKNGFHFLVEDERLEAKYVGVGVGQLPLRTRLMYFDLLTLKVNND